MTKVFMDITADSAPLGRLIFKVCSVGRTSTSANLQLNTEKCPKTCENFMKLCTGELGFGYKSCVFYRVVPTFCACVSHRNLVRSPRIRYISSRETSRRRTNVVTEANRHSEQSISTTRTSRYRMTRSGSSCMSFRISVFEEAFWAWTTTDGRIRTLRGST